MFAVITKRRDDGAARRAQLVGLLSYPLFLLLLTMIAVLILSLVLVPALEPIFAGNGEKAPFVFKALSGLNEFLNSPAGLIAALALLGLIAAAAVPSGRQWLRARLARLAHAAPLTASIMRKLATARFLGSLALLLANGMLLTRSLESAAMATTEKRLRERLAGISRDVGVGGDLAKAFAAAGVFDDRIISMIAVGDAANRLATVVGQAGRMIETEAETALGRLIAVITPALTIFLGVIIGGFSISVMSALLRINEIAIQ
jgi:general secretion pathway protein F